MTVRLGFAIATQLKPDLLIVDEVLAVGDLAFKAKCMKHLQSLKAEGTSIVLVSHQPGHSAQLCDRTIVFDRGKIIADLPVEEGIEAYQKLLQLSAEAQALADGEMPAKETPAKRRRKKTMNGRRRRRSRTLVAEGGAVAAGEVALRRRRRTM